MNFNQSINKIRQGGKIILIFTLIGVLISWWRLSVALPSFSGSITLTIYNKSTQVSNQYSYDSYYSNLASSQLFDTISSQITSPSYIKKVYSDANVGLDIANIKDASKIFSIDKFTQTSSSGYISIKGVNNQRDLDSLLSSLKLNISDLSTKLHANNGISENLSIILSDPVTFESQPNMMVYIGSGLILGLLISVLFLLVIQSIKEN